MIFLKILYSFFLLKTEGLFNEKNVVECYTNKKICALKSVKKVLSPLKGNNLGKEILFLLGKIFIEGFRLYFANQNVQNSLFF